MTSVRATGLADDFNYRSAAAGMASACERGDEEEVQFLLHAGVEVDTRFEVRRAPCLPNCHYKPYGNHLVEPQHPCVRHSVACQVPFIC